MTSRVYSVIIFNTVIQFLTAECPPDAEQRIQLCIKSSLPNFGLGPPLDASHPAALKTSIEMSRESCQTKKLESSVICMQNFLDQCRGTTDREQLLQRLFDKQKIMETVQYFCASLPIYEKHAECISNQHTMVLNCSKDETVRYMRIMGAKPTYDVLIQANCRFHRIATSCLEDYVFDNCGQEAAEFIETITLLQAPPSCEAKKRKYSKGYQSPENQANYLYFSFLNFFTILIIQWILK